MAANSATTVVAMTTAQRDLFGDVDDDGILSLVGLACFVITPITLDTGIKGGRQKIARCVAFITVALLHCRVVFFLRCSSLNDHCHTERADAGQ